MEMATRGGIEWRRNFTFDRNKTPVPLIEARYLSKQRAGIRMSGCGKQCFGGGTFHDPAQIHDEDTVSNMLDYTKVVADEEIGEVELLAQASEEIDDLCLDRDIQRGDRFVTNDEIGLHS